MSTTIAPTPDCENDNLMVRGKQKISAMEGRSLPGNLKQMSQLSQVKKFGSTQRSFGDISNRVGRVGNDSQLGSVKKMHSQPENMPSVQKVSPHTSSMMSHDLEFIPEITETEDYSDILPPEFQLTKQDISRFSLWTPWQKPDLSFFNVPASPPRSNTLAATVEEPKSLLEHVMEDVFLPPPWE